MGQCLMALDNTKLIHQQRIFKPQLRVIVIVQIEQKEGDDRHGNWMNMHLMKSVRYSQNSQKYNHSPLTLI